MNSTINNMRLKSKARSSAAYLGCTVAALVLIAIIICTFIFGAYIGSEVCEAVGWTTTSSVVHFIIGIISLSLIGSALVAIIVWAFMIIMGIIVFFNS
jgi:hypothetical protein